ncbi:MAG: DEAD/DEAH box helicase family protein [Actinomycetota bacterium]|nr:DEAD/DEAH box helicase family protein [Actinomycetota bacterium]
MEVDQVTAEAVSDRDRSLGAAPSVSPPVGGMEVLRAELAAARAEIARLEAENKLLRAGGSEIAPALAHRSQRAPTLFAPSGDALSHVDSSSPREEKIRLYRSLFAGRADVYAQRWENSSTGKSGWSPVTLGERRSSPTRRYAPVDDAVIGAHLSGQLAAGVYPLVEGDRCWLLACDFDKGSWAFDALAFLEVCTETGVPAALERSRSGNGAHVWIFFEEPVSATVARRLGTRLLRETMALRAEVDLTSYDRLFPSQDFVPAKGFGNLIALPLQGRSRKEANTVFLDPATMSPWEDQWAFLSALRRLGPSDAKHIGETIELSAGPGTAGSGTVGRSARPGPPPPPVVTATMGAMLAVERIGLPPALVASLKHLASVHNPDFHRREQLRRSTWNTPRMIRCYDEDLDRLYLPRGLVEDAAKVVDAVGSRLVVEDHRPLGPRQRFGFTGQLTLPQQAAVGEIAEHDLGVLVAPTGAGKTVMACALIAQIATPTLVLVHTKPLAEQWRQQLGDLLGLARRDIGQLGAGRTRMSGLVDLATLQSLARREDAPEIFARYGLVIVDECHHLPAATFERCVRRAPNRRWVGLTATPRRSDGLEGILHMQLGPVRHALAVDAATTVLVRRDLVVHDTLADPDASDGTPVQVILGQVAADEDRNRQICTDVADAYRRGRNTLVLTDRTEHLEALRAQLASAHGLEAAVLKGGTAKVRHATILAGLRASDTPVLLLATGAYLGEGFDLPVLDTLFLAFPISGRTRIIQYVGRVTRALPGKISVEVHDYHDTLHPLLRRMHQRRLTALRGLGFAPTSTR